MNRNDLICILAISCSKFEWGEGWLTLTQKHSDSGKVAMISRKEKRVKMKAQMPGPPGSAVNGTQHDNQYTTNHSTAALTANTTTAAAVQNEQPLSPSKAVAIWQPMLPPQPNERLKSIKSKFKFRKALNCVKCVLKLSWLKSKGCSLPNKMYGF